MTSILDKRLHARRNGSALCKGFRSALAVVAAIIFIVFTHPPLAIHADYPHDDALYMALGKRLASGEWLGPYSQFTLMKGPGYPLFLAANSWLGLPVSLSHALFHCGAIGFFFWVFARISRMPNLALCGFVFTLWAPVDYFDRVTRDAIYPGQMLLVFGSLCYALLANLPRRNRVAWAALCGLSVGWMALTREEGVWIVPGIAVISFYALWISWRRGAIVPNALAPLLAIAVVIMSTFTAFSAANKIAYGAATGIETNSAPFTTALQALQAVQVGERTPYLPVSRQARLAIYRESPSFRQLRQYFDPVGGATPWPFGCQFYRATCGDIAGGWFLWALRDAVATQGAYTSPAAAADFYRKLALEINQACTHHRLSCSPTLPAPLPHISYTQWRNIPTSLASGIRQATYAQAPDITPEASSGDPAEIVSGIAFLGRPMATPVAHDATKQIYRVTGWYRSPNNDWVSGLVERSDGNTAQIAIRRIASPDLVTGFKDPNATHQRFDLEVACEGSCNVRFTGDNGSSVLLNLPGLLGRRPYYSLGPATLNIDSVADSNAGGQASDLHLQTATSMRRIGIQVYQVAVPWLASFAAFAMLLTLLRARLARRLELVAALAAAVWVLLASRLMILAVVDISLFPGMITQYLSAANVLVCLAVVLSSGALFESVKHSASQRALSEKAPRVSDCAV